MPQVSVITPCYNADPFVARTLESVQRQTFPDWEQVIIDDGSTDGSKAVIERYLADSRIQLISQANQGVAVARNHGFAASDPNSSYLLFLDADDALDPAMLQTLATYLDQHPQVGMVYCGCRIVDPDDQVISIPELARFVPAGWNLRQLPATQPETPLTALLTLRLLIPSICLIRRSSYLQTSGWDETFGQPFEDLDLFLQIGLISQIHYLDQPLVDYRRHPYQSTTDPSRLHRQQEKLRQKWWHHPAQIMKQAWRFREGRFVPYLGIREVKTILWTQHRYGEGIRFLLGAIRRYCLWGFFG